MIDYRSNYTGEQIDDGIKIIGDVSSTTASHNGLYRGADLTNKYTIEQLYTKVHAGDFSDLYLGDYITVSITTDLYKFFTGSAFASGTSYYERSGSGVTNWTYIQTSDTEYNSSKTYYTKQTISENVDLMIAHFDYYMNTGNNNPVTNHHLILIPRAPQLLNGASMHTVDSTANGYTSSEMNLTTLPCYGEAFKTALNNHLLTHEARLSTVVDPNLPSMAGSTYTGGVKTTAFTVVLLQLMSENQIFGTTNYASSGVDAGVDINRFSVFNFINPQHIDYTRNPFWTRTIMASNAYVLCSRQGQESGNVPTAVSGVRPFMLFG